MQVRGFESGRPLAGIGWDPVNRRSRLADNVEDDVE
jgi:hypothetical protein